MNKSSKCKNNIIIALFIFSLIIILSPILLFLWLILGDHSMTYEFSQPFENIASIEIVNIESDRDVYKQNFDAIDEAFMVEYNDGSCEVVDEYGGYYYDSAKDEDKYKYCCFENEPFEELIEKYIALSK